MPRISGVIVVNEYTVQIVDCAQAIDCQALTLQTTDIFAAGPTISNSIDNSTCAITYTSRAQLASGILEYNGQTSLPNSSIYLSVVDNLGEVDPAHSFVIRELLPYSLAGSKVGQSSIFICSPQQTCEVSLPCVNVHGNCINFADMNISFPSPAFGMSLASR